MNNKPDNPPAFAVTPVRDPGGRLDPDCYHGMTLRDYFAAKAMQVILTNKLLNKLGVLGCNSFEHNIAEDAYIQADAMLKARNS